MINMEVIAETYAHVIKERERQEQLHSEDDWPVTDGDFEWLDTMVDKWRKICDALLIRGKATWFHIAIEEFFEAFAERDPAAQVVELEQCIAVLFRTIEGIKRKEG